MSSPRIPKTKTNKPTTITDLLERDKQLMLRSQAKKKMLLTLKLREYEQVIEYAEKWDCTVSEALRTLLTKGLEYVKKWGSESDLDPANSGRWVPKETYVDPVTHRPSMPVVFDPRPPANPMLRQQYQPRSQDVVTRSVETVFDDAPKKRGNMALVFPSGATITPPDVLYSDPPQSDEPDFDEEPI